MKSSRAATGVLIVSVMASIGVAFVSTGDGSMSMSKTDTYAPAGTKQKADDDPGLEAGAKPACIWKNAGDEYSLSKKQAEVAKYIIEQATPNAVGREGAVVAMIAAGVESEVGVNVINEAGGWYGIFQMTPGKYWGTKEQVLDTKYATKRFYDELKKIKGWKTMKPGAAAQAVEKSANPARYLEKKRLERASIIVDVFLTGNVALKDVECVAVAQDVPTATSGINQGMTWALTMIGNPYVFGGNGPKGWDCSSFVREVLKRGGAAKVNTMPRTAQAQLDWCKAGNCTPVTGGAQAGDLIFWNSYLGPKEIGHVVLVHDPVKKTTIEAHRTCRAGMKGAGKDCGIGHFSYATQMENKELFHMMRPKWTNAAPGTKATATATAKAKAKPAAKPAGVR